MSLAIFNGYIRAYRLARGKKIWLGHDSSLHCIKCGEGVVPVWNPVNNSVVAIENGYENGVVLHECKPLPKYKCTACQDTKLEWTNYDRTGQDSDWQSSPCRSCQR